MKKSIIYLTISATLTFSGCDYLDDMPYDWAQPDDIFTNEQNYLKPINQVYAYIPEGFNHVGNAFLDAATNDGISTIIDSDIHIPAVEITFSGSKTAHVAELVIAKIEKEHYL